MNKIAIFVDNLNVGGIQKSIINMLNNIDYKKYEVDLYMFNSETFYTIPNEVNIIKLKKPLKLLQFIPFELAKAIYKPKILDKEYSSKQVRAYNIDGVLISRYKVLRYMTTLIYNGMNESKDMLMYAITKNSFLTKEEYEKIETVVENIFQNIKRM